MLQMVEVDVVFIYGIQLILIDNGNFYMAQSGGVRSLADGAASEGYGLHLM